MTKDLLMRLEARADSAATDSERWVLRAQWACAAARFGQIEVARAEISNLRSKNSQYSPQLTAWIFLAEGLADHFESLSATAVDRFKRAYGLAVAFSDAEIRSLAAAWLGASEFLLANYEAASLHAAEAIQHAPKTGSLALSRAHLVLANCLNVVGAEVLSAAHYAQARRFAVEARDIAMQSAILYNVAAFHTSRISIEDAFGESVEQQWGGAELEVNSISNLDTGIGLESLGAMVPLLRAQLLLVKKEWAKAGALYAQYTEEAATHGQSRLAPRYLAERAHCQSALGESADARRSASDAMNLLAGRVDADDLAACHARLSLCFSALGDEAESEAHRLAAEQCRADFRSFQLAHKPRIVSIAEAMPPISN